VELAEDRRIRAVEQSPAGDAGLHAVVHGDVQGVGFRYFVIRSARERRLTGWVRNRADGGVECLAEGPKGALERLLDDLRRGPGLAAVQSVDFDWRPATGNLQGFDVRG
jgi:acylphosphatase